MITVAILINGEPIMARSAVNKGEQDPEGRTLYEVDDGARLYHRRGDGPVPLAIKMLETIVRHRYMPEGLKAAFAANEQIKQEKKNHG